jgi:hypothetical protein
MSITMKKYAARIFMVIVITAPIACKQREKASDASAMSADSTSACYRWIQDRDTIQLSVKFNNGRVEGTLDFLFYEKDKSRGTIQGNMKGDTLFADYLFNSEGMTSQREVAFLRTKNSFLMGYGETTSHQNKELFKDPRHIIFDPNVELHKLPCD